MENTRKRIMGMLFFCILVVMAGCGNSSDELSGKSNNESPTQNTDDDFSKKDLINIEKDTAEHSSEGTEKTGNNNGAMIDSANKNTAQSTNNRSLKGEYFKKLKNTKNEAEKLEATDSSTYAMKKVENDRWELWDQLLNEIYGVLKEQLSPKEMEQLREEQRNWVKYRDSSALEASLKYKGGTQEHLEYVAVLANLTEERCYELIEIYMK